MPRIRTIKPEFPQSESMGRVSREARLLFVQLWTICDDAGRTRASSRMLASLLYPYDDDAPKRIDGWLSELEREKCLIRYQVDGATYLQVCNWLNHQKIDRPSASKIPPFDESSRALANPREPSSGDRDLDLDRERDLEGDREAPKAAGAAAPARAPKKTATRIPDDLELSVEMHAYAVKELPRVDAASLFAEFVDHWKSAAGEKARKADWPAAWRMWVRRSARYGYPMVKEPAVAQVRQLRYDANGRQISG